MPTQSKAWQIDPGTKALWAARGILWLVRICAPLFELTLPPHKRARFRESRQRLNELDQESRAMLRQVKADPSRVMELTGDFIDRHGDREMREQWLETQARFAARRDESDRLKTIRESAENDTEAAARLRSYIAEHPTSYLAHLSLGATMFRMQDCDGSLGVYREAIRLAGAGSVSESTSRIRVGECLRLKGELDAAAAELRIVIENPPDHAQSLVCLAHLELGRVRLDANDLQGARSEWKLAFRTDRFGAAAEKARELLKRHR